MVKVQFYDQVDDQKLRFAVIITRTNGQWVFCKHRERDTLEVPGGHRESRGKTFWTQQSVNCMKKREPLIFPLSLFTYILLLHPGISTGRKPSACCSMRM